MRILDIEASSRAKGIRENANEPNTISGFIASGLIISAAS